MHKASFFVITLLLPFSAFAYSFDDVGHYTDEQYRQDVKAYLDYERQQQETQQYQQTVNNILHQPAPSVGSGGNAPTEYDIAQLQKQIDQSAELSKQQQSQIDQLNNILQKQSDTRAAQADADTTACKGVQEGQSAGRMYYLEADAVARCKSLGVPIMTQQENLEAVIAGIRADAARSTNATDATQSDERVSDAPPQQHQQGGSSVSTRSPHVSFADYYENSGGASASDTPVEQNTDDQDHDFFGTRFIALIFHSIRSWFNGFGF